MPAKRRRLRRWKNPNEGDELPLPDQELDEDQEVGPAISNNDGGNDRMVMAPEQPAADDDSAGSEMTFSRPEGNNTPAEEENKGSEEEEEENKGHEKPQAQEKPKPQAQEKPEPEHKVDPNEALNTMKQKTPPASSNALSDILRAAVEQAEEQEAYVGQLQRMLTDSENELTQAQGTLREYHANLERCYSEISSLQDEVKRLAALQAASSQVEKEKLEAIAQLGRAESKIATLTSENSALRSKHLELQTIAERHRSNRSSTNDPTPTEREAALSRKVLDLEISDRHLRQQLAQTRADFDSYKDTTKKWTCRLETDNAKLRQCFQDAQRDVQKLNERITQHRCIDERGDGGNRRDRPHYHRDEPRRDHHRSPPRRSSDGRPAGDYRRLRRSEAGFYAKNNGSSRAHRDERRRTDDDHTHENSNSQRETLPSTPQKTQESRHSSNKRNRSLSPVPIDPVILLAQDHQATASQPGSQPDEKAMIQQQKPQVVPMRSPSDSGAILAKPPTYEAESEALWNQQQQLYFPSHLDQLQSTDGGRQIINNNNNPYL